MQILPYVCLWITILATLVTQSHTFFAIGLIISFAVGLLEGAMTWVGLLELLLIGAIAQWHFQIVPLTRLKKILKGITFLGMIIIAMLLCLHLAPGFHNLLVITAEHTSPLATAFTMYLNFDKIAMGFLLLFISQIPLNMRYFFNGKMLLKAFPIMLSCIVFLMGAGLLSGYVTFDFKVPHFTTIWILNNLLFVCIVEEVLFRGILQQTFVKLADKCKIHFLWPLILSSIIFGVAHFKAGVIFMGLATVAGLFYGYAYQKTQRLEAAILTHFMLNFTHFLFFTYPARIV